MRKILITGAAGFIPSSLAERLIEDKETFVVGVDNFITGKMSNLSKLKTKNFKFINLNVNNYEEISSVMTTYNFDFVFHYAALVGVKRTLENPLMVLEDVKGIQNILLLSKNTDVKQVYFSSSSEVYGEPVEIPQNELTTPLNSKLPYAVVKNVGEAFLKSFNQIHGLKYTIFRFFNTYGIKQSDDFVISKFINNAINNKNITIYGDGLQTRTFCYIDDNVETSIKCLNHELHINDIVNIGSNKEVNIKELASIIIKLTSSSSKIVSLPPLVDGDMRRRCPDNSKMRKILGRDMISLEQGIKLILLNRHLRNE